MLIDEFLPQYHVAKRYQIDIQAPAESVYAAVRSLDLSGLALTRWLLKLRGYSPGNLSIEDLNGSDFILLGEKENEELLLGVIGRFWSFSGGLQCFTVPEFIPFNRPGFAKAAWNFFLQPAGKDVTRLATETRIYCTDKKALRKFRLYWTFVGPFSGLIRKEMLQAVKRKVE